MGVYGRQHLIRLDELRYALRPAALGFQKCSLDGSVQHGPMGESPCNMIIPDRTHEQVEQ